MRIFPAFFCLVFLIGCATNDLTGPTSAPDEPVRVLLPASEGAVRIIFSVLDSEGQPFRPDQAWWYYTPNEQGYAEEYEAVCADEDCTRFAVTGATDGRVYVAASYRRAHVDPLCSFGGYDAFPVEVTEGEVPEVTLRLVELESCQ